MLIKKMNRLGIVQKVKERQGIGDRFETSCMKMFLRRYRVPSFVSLLRLVQRYSVRRYMIDK